MKKTKAEVDLEKINLVNELGLNRHFGEDNPRWNGGNRLSGNFPCPQCGVDRICEKRNAYRICAKCFKNRGKKFDQEEYSKKRYKEIKRTSKEYAIKYKGGCCELCGIDNLPQCCYHFHHKDPSAKKFSVSPKLAQKITDEVLEEIDKCLLLCANCHAIVHWYKEIEV